MATDFEFRKQVLDMHMSGVIKYCYQCNRCTDNCLVAEVTDNAYNPRQNILNALLGFKDAIFSAEKIAIWGCTVCDTCDEVCPQNIELTEIFKLLKNHSVANGDAPDFYYLQAKTIFENAKAVPSQPAIERRREQLGLPAVAAPDINELTTLLKNMGIDKKLKGE